MFLVSTNRVLHLIAALLIGLFVCSLIPANADDNAGANQRFVEAAGHLRQADALWASEPWTEGATLTEFLDLMTIIPGSYQRFVDSRPASQVAAMTLAFRRVAALLQNAVDILKSIPSAYPSSNLAVALITGQPVGDIAIPDLEEKLATLRYLISVGSPVPPHSPSEAATPPTAPPQLPELPDPQTVQACIDDPDFTKPDCLATFARDAHELASGWQAQEILIALAHIAGAYQAAGQEQASADTLASAADILEREIADAQLGDDPVMNTYALAFRAALHGLARRDPRAYADATAELAQAVRALPPSADRDTAAQEIIYLFAIWGLFPDDVLSLTEIIEDPAARLDALNALTSAHTVAGNLRAALHAAHAALAHAENHPDPENTQSLDTAASFAFALTEGFTPETEHLVAAIPSLALEDIADHVLITTYAGTGDIDDARASLARISNEFLRFAALSFIVKAQARNGNYAEARSTAKAIPDLSDRIKALTYVALHQAGDLPDLPSAPRLGRKNRRILRDRALAHIARAHLAAHNLETAQEAANLMSNRSARNELKDEIRAYRQGQQ